MCLFCSGRKCFAWRKINSVPAETRALFQPCFPVPANPQRTVYAARSFPQRPAARGISRASAVLLAWPGQASDSSPRAGAGHSSSSQVQGVWNGRGKSCKEAYTMLVVNKDFANLNLSASIVSTCWLLETSVSHPRRAKAQSGQKAGSDGRVSRQAHVRPQLQNSERPETRTRHPVPAVATCPLEKVRNKSLELPCVSA